MSSNQPSPYRPTASAVTANGLVSGARKSRFQIVGRDLCAFVWLDQHAVADRRARRREAELEALRVAQSPDAGLYMVLWPAGAAIWSWDNSAVDAIVEQGEQDNQGELIRVPEPLMQAPEIGSDAFRLIACLRGFEGQYWRGGALVASRWWSHMPTDADWLVFATALEAQEQRAPSARAPQPLAAPFAPNEHRPAKAELINPRMAFWGGVATLAMAMAGLTYVGGVEVRYLLLDNQVRALDRQAAPMRAVRAQVRADGAEYDRLSKWLRGTNGAELISNVAAILVQAHVRANSVELRGDRVIITAPRNFAPASDLLLKLMEDSPQLSNARLGDASTLAGEMQVQANLELPR